MTIGRAASYYVLSVNPRARFGEGSAGVPSRGSARTKLASRREKTLECFERARIREATAHEGGILLLAE
jgi:hypothetical protein